MSPTPSCPACGLRLPLHGEDAPQVCPECGAACAEPDAVLDVEAVAQSEAVIDELEEAVDEVSGVAPVKPRRKWLWRAVRAAACLLFAALVAGGIFAAMCWDDLKAWTTNQVWIMLAKPPARPPAAASAPAGQPRSGMPGPGPAPVLMPGFDGWVQDLEIAKIEAAKTGRDVLLLFDGSDWCGWSIRLGYEVLFKAPFRDRAREKFVLVLIDFPQNVDARTKVQDAARNDRLKDQYGADGFPCVILTDAEGRPYAQTGYQEGGPESYLGHLTTLQKQRIERDELLKAVAEANGVAKLKAAKAALEHLRNAGFLDFYGKLVDEWSQLARQHDPRNEEGFSELFFEVDWLARAQQAKTAAAQTELVAALNAWKKDAQFKDADRAALLHLYAGRLLAAAGDPAAALELVRTGLAYKPANRALLSTLSNSITALGFFSATGFVITADGLMLTNAHVVKGEGKALVRLPGGLAPAPAEVVARDDERDIALLRVALPAGTTLKPLKLRSVLPVGRGEQVAAFGYPLGDLFGSQVKLTTGVISAVPEPSNNRALILDAKVNPGNSGGPLCDARGNVVGMVTAKSLSGSGIDSYGMALPTPDLCDFLKKHMKDFRPAPARTTKTAWDEVDRLVSGSVLMILKAPPQARAAAGADEGRKPAKNDTPRTQAP